MSLGKDSSVPRPVESAKAGKIVAPFHRLADSIIVTSDWLLNVDLLTTADSNHIAPLARSVPVAGKRGFLGSMLHGSPSAQNPSILPSILLAPPTRGDKIRVISAQIEFLGGTTRAVARVWSGTLSGL